MALSHREEVIEFIKTIPENKIIYVMDLFNGIKGLLNEDAQSENQNKQDIWEEIKGLYGIVNNPDLDEKAELAEARDEKNARFN